ncbi:CIC11C00000002151 [Sungouiella intermedia]|uniref:CIC11C00000002151 n=1 Tax=Sungouiella intermedia TaxID=45354 RepID=A0A1L0DJF2_9ASCO|nr:CIC11C00000002151 [[Candida] intermedia]
MSKVRIPTVRYSEPIDYTRNGTENWTSKQKYENNTFIDWMKESSAGWQDNAPSKKWLVLVVTSIIVGYITIFIDLLSVWLNDLKKGLCFSKLDKWSLLNPYLTCPADDWYDWLRVFSGHDGFFSNFLFNLPIYLIFVCAFVVAAGYITSTRAPLVKQSGIPEMKLIILGFNYYMDTYLGASSLVYKVLGLILVVSSGVWLGKEGPLVHISCCMLTICFRYIYGNTITEGLRRELLSAATATGIAVAFNSPIGGVLFAVEMLPSYFTPTRIMWNSFVCATIALITLSGVRLFTEGKHFHEEVLFEVLFGNFSWLFMETIPFIFLGLLGGFYGFSFTKVYLHFSDVQFKSRIRSRLSALFKVDESKGKYFELLLMAIVTAVLTFMLPLTKLPLSAFMRLLFTDCPEKSSTVETNSTNFMCHPSSFSTVLKLGYIVIQGFFLSAYAYGLHIPGGILMPSLVLGGAAGRIVGIISLAIQNSIDAEYLSTCTAKSCVVSPSSYAVVGAASFVTGITKLALSVVVVMFELTGAVTYVLPIMIAVMTSKFFNDWLCDQNIYDAWLNNEFNVPGYSPLHEVNCNKGNGICNFANLSSRFKSMLPDVAVSQAMIPLIRTRHLVVFPEEPYSVSALHSFLADDCHEGYPLIASETNPVSLGYVFKNDVYKQLQRVVGNVQTSSQLVCFETQVPKYLENTKAEFEEELSNRFANVSLVPIEAEPATLLVRDNSSLKNVIEVFERLHLNYLVLLHRKNNNEMSGFIDRFILLRLINLKFAELNKDADLEGMIAHEFDVTYDDFDDTTTMRRQRESIELIT